MILLGNKYWEVKKTQHKGRGIFAKKDIPAGVVLGDYVGKILRTRDVDFDQDKNLYLMYYHDSASIYPDLTKPGVHLLNHSCSPNCWIYTYQKHTLVFTLRKISAGEELTISYLLAPKSKFHKKCTHQCMCQSLNCSKTMHLTQEKYKKWQEFQEEPNKPSSRKEKVNYGSFLKPLPKYPKTIPLNPIYALISS